MGKAYLILVGWLVTLAAAFGLDYSADEMWVYRENGTPTPDKPVDVFFLSPTVGMGNVVNLDVNDPASRANTRRAVDDEKGIYADAARFFSPYYRMKSMPHRLDPKAQEVTYSDVKAAFLHYLEHDNQGRPFIIAGFSQGSQQAMFLIQDVLSDPKIAGRMVAAYLIGLSVTERETSGHPQLKPAQGESDTGVFVSWNTESADTKGSMLVPADTLSLCINPLNWKTDATPAPPELNEGARMDLGPRGKLQPHYCGAVINPKRGTVNPVFTAEHPAPPHLHGGSYHGMDPCFFYENHRRNVQTRIRAFMERMKKNRPA